MFVCVSTHFFVFFCLHIWILLLNITAPCLHISKNAQFLCFYIKNTRNVQKRIMCNKSAEMCKNSADMCTITELCKNSSENCKENAQNCVSTLRAYTILFVFFAILGACFAHVRAFVHISERLFCTFQCLFLHISVCLI